MRRSTTREVEVENPSDPRVLAIDTALAMAAHRHLVPAAEATQLLHSVQAALEDGEASSMVERIIDDALSSYEDELLLDRDRVVNPLLDVRSALQR